MASITLYDPDGSEHKPRWENIPYELLCSRVLSIGRFFVEGIWYDIIYGKVIITCQLKAGSELNNTVFFSTDGFYFYNCQALRVDWVLSSHSQQ